MITESPARDQSAASSGEIAQSAGIKAAILIAIGLSIAAPVLLVDWQLDDGSGHTHTEDTAHSADLIGQVAGLIGIVGAVILWWQYILGIRPILGRLNRDWAWTNARHRNLGIYGSALIAFHPVLMLYINRGNLSLIIGLDFTVPFRRWVAFGQAAFTLLAVVWVSSFILRRRIGFRRWKWIHYLGYAVLPLVFLHGSNVGSLISGTPALQTYWRLLIGGYVIAVTIRLAHGLWIGRHRYRLGQADYVASGVQRYRFERMGQGLSARPGQFVYLQLRRFGEDHPFTVVAVDAATGSIDIVAKNVGRFSGQMALLPPGTVVSLDGPYGSFTVDAERSGRPLLLVAGGIGITPFVHLLREEPEVKLAYAVRTLDDTAFRTDVERLGERAVLAIEEPASYFGPLPCVAGRITLDDLRRLSGVAGLAAHEIFVCGPPPMMDAITSALIADGVPARHIHTERFSL